MNVLNNLDSFQKRILSKIIENFNIYTCSFSSSVSIDESCMFLSYLMYDILNTGIYVEEMYIATYKDSSQVNFEIVFDTPQMEADGINDTEEYIYNYVQTTKLELIQFLDFIYQLFNHGLIVFSDEEELETEFSEWASADNQLCKNKGFSIETFSFSSTILKRFVDKCYNAAIIPNSTLIDFVNNKFLSEEQINFRKSQKLGKAAILTSLFIAVISPWLMTTCSKSTIEPMQLETIINAIPERVDEVRLNQEQMDSIISIIKNTSQHNGKTTNEKP